MQNKIQQGNVVTPPRFHFGVNSNNINKVQDIPDKAKQFHGWDIGALAKLDDETFSKIDLKTCRYWGNKLIQ